jgi:hypothetical protein
MPGLGLRLGVGTFPPRRRRAFTPASLASFVAWYAFDRGDRWQDAGKTTPATDVDDPVHTIEPYLGAGPDFVAEDDDEQFLIAATGLTGDGTKKGYSATWDLSGAHTIVTRHKCGAADAATGFVSCWGVTAEVGWFIRDFQAPCNFQENADAAVTQLGGTFGEFGTFGVGVSADGVGTGFKSDGTTAAIDGSNGSTIHDANSTVYWGASLFGTGPSGADRPLSDLLFFDAVLSAGEFVKVQTFLASLRP